MDIRTANISRKTAETEIRVSLDIDGTGAHNISTGIGFFDHMLTHLARHGLFNLNIQAVGDLHIDPHHTIEDVAMVLGRAFGQALGERRGIVRMAEATVPMDEALASVAIDIGGRGYAVVDSRLLADEVGGLESHLFTHFFHSFAQEARLNIHARVLYGANEHHKVEALFKAFAKALDRASQLDPRLGSAVPSTKGSIEV